MPIFPRFEESYLYPLRLLSYRQTLFLFMTHYMISSDIHLTNHHSHSPLTYYCYLIFRFTFRIRNKLLHQYSLNNFNKAQNNSTISSSYFTILSLRQPWENISSIIMPITFSRLHCYTPYKENGYKSICIFWLNYHFLFSKDS